MVMQYGGYVIVMKVKDIRLKVIPSKLANEFVRKYHYSGKVVPNSKLHFGAFYNNVLHGVMSYGSPLDKSKVIGLVKNTKWNGMLELNRMAFDDILPKNSESRCIAISFKLIKKHAPHIKWILSFSDAIQCGDGTIYRASGFVLTLIRQNTNIRIDPETNKPIHTIANYHKGKAHLFKNYKKLKGYQLRYVYFIDKVKKKDLTVPIIPFTKLKELGISVYKGKKLGIDGVSVAHLATSKKEEVQVLPQCSNS
jgi:hypothetical protein